VVSLGLAIFFLGETLTPLRIIGILLIVVGPMFVSRDRTRRSLTAPEDAEPDEARVLPPSVAAHGAFDPRFAEGYVFAFFASICYGATPPLVRYAVGGQGLTASIAGGVIATSAATLVAAVMLLLPRMRHDVRAVKLEAAKWFILSGVIVYISQIFAYMAVALAPVTITAPIIGLNNVFRIHVARLLNPHHEVFGPQVITATAVSFFGVVVLSIDPAVLPLPEQWIALLSWRWP
jgi:drug/metabolite transporter (DMT)-like permease